MRCYRRRSTHPWESTILMFSQPPSPTNPSGEREELWNLYSNHRTSPGDLFALANHPDQYEESVEADLDKLSSDSLTRLLKQADAATKNPHCVVPTGPLPGNRSEPEKNFASPYVFGACCKLILEDNVSVTKIHYDILYGGPTTSTAAGMVFEHRPLSAETLLALGDASV